MVKERNRIDLTNAFLGLQEAMKAKLSSAADLIPQPTSKGDAAELNWLGTLKDFLPKRYQADRAFIVDCFGGCSDHIDIVIYDRHYSPFLLCINKQKFIPSESVYAVLEVKQTVNKTNIVYAGKKAASVRSLNRTSVPIPHAAGTADPKKPAHILAGILALKSDWKAPIQPMLLSALGQLNISQRLDLGCVLV